MEAQLKELIDKIKTEGVDEAEQKADLHADRQGLAVQFEGGRIVDIVGADAFLVQPVDDLLARLEFHQGRAVELPELGKRGSEMAEDLGVEVV